MLWIKSHIITFRWRSITRNSIQFLCANYRIWKWNKTNFLKMQMFSDNTITEGKMNLWNSNQGDMKRPSFLSTISILILNIEETLFKTVHWYFFKRFSSICKNTIEIVLRKDRRFILPWLLFHEFKNIQYYSYTIE